MRSCMGETADFFGVMGDALRLRNEAEKCVGFYHDITGSTQ